jgi:hypothetical protein
MLSVEWSACRNVNSPLVYKGLACIIFSSKLFKSSILKLFAKSSLNYALWIWYSKSTPLFLIECGRLDSLVDSILGRARDFSVRRNADRLWGPLSFLSSGVPGHLFSGMKRPERDADHLFYSVDVYLNSMPSWPAQGPLYLYIVWSKWKWNIFATTFGVKYDTFAHKSKL